MNLFNFQLSVTCVSCLRAFTVTAQQFENDVTVDVESCDCCGHSVSVTTSVKCPHCKASGNVKLV